MSEIAGRVRRAVEDRNVLDLRRRVRVLEEEVQECRQLNRRVAELTDIMTELLLPLSQRDEVKVRDLLSRYQDRL